MQVDGSSRLPFPRKNWMILQASEKMPDRTNSSNVLDAIVDVHSQMSRSEAVEFANNFGHAANTGVEFANKFGQSANTNF